MFILKNELFQIIQKSFLNRFNPHSYRRRAVLWYIYPHSYRNLAGLLVRVRVGDPERIIEVPGCVDGEGLDVIAKSVFKLVGSKI